MRAAIARFVASREKNQGTDFVGNVIVRQLGGKVDRGLLEDLVQIACVRVLEAKSPPWLASGIAGWVGRATRRAVVDYFREGESDREFLERDAETQESADPDAPHTDAGARERLIVKYLEGASATIRSRRRRSAS